MITAYRGRIRVTTDETEMKGDLACVSKCIYKEGKSRVCERIRVFTSDARVNEVFG